MSSPGQKRWGCRHVMASFDSYSFCAWCRDKGKGKDPCIEKPDTTDCKFCNSLTEDQHLQLATPSYKLKKEKREAKKMEASSSPSKDSTSLVDPATVSVIGAVNVQVAIPFWWWAFYYSLRNLRKTSLPLLKPRLLDLRASRSQIQRLLNSTRNGPIDSIVWKPSSWPEF